ncbi:hypothetical protein BD289DRAFT_425646 [Coniella lustricola]|uniref:Uncharacterized protein n=1 Tax=Coniella lustricola TaxID=2025994 RepID=A0A2T3AGZ8_9PEZI|nr:hypothetical protein BD289DRAFT_425646 [Coniella lustricola]
MYGLQGGRGAEESTNFLAAVCWNAQRKEQNHSGDDEWTRISARRRRSSCLIIASLRECWHPSD